MEYLTVIEKSNFDIIKNIKGSSKFVRQTNREGLPANHIEICIKIVDNDAFKEAMNIFYSTGLTRGRKSVVQCC